ncbi:MAG: hypothetical protein JXR96_01735 [Deltaproteobacteria bacterium]|nr:hypothetical protein [Deltaproteobacteria bacterium]
MPLSFRVSLASCLAWALCACSGGGSVCEDVDCGEHGECVEAGGLPACLCDPGFVPDGLSCVTDPCAASPCVFGTCRASGRNAICDCEPGYTGALCDTCAPGYHLEGMRCELGSACEDDPCVYGRCRAEGGLPVCDCYPGYAGERCDACAPGYHAVDLACVSDTPCDPDPCVHGACYVEGGRAACTCDVGYAGERCDTCAEGYREEGLVCVPEIGGPCDPNPCTEPLRQLCQVVEPDSHVCLCNPGYVEVDGLCVAESACQPNPCTQPQRSVCVEDGGGGFVCYCDPGYHDQEGVCAADTPCNPNPCTTVHRTVCVEQGEDAFSCDCDSGYHDQDGDCAADTPCSPNPCVEPHKTRCEILGEGYACHCDPGYHMEAGTCAADTVCGDQTTCSGHGHCTGVGLECACDPGYAGEHCEACDAGYHQDGDACVPDSPCDPNPCTTVHRTQCTVQGTSFACSCDPGYQDADGNGSCLPDCQTAGLDCGPHGQCQIVLGQASCVCQAGHTGEACADCAAGYQDHDGDGLCRPTCETAGLDCGERACDDSSGEPVCVGVRDCTTELRYMPGSGETVTALYVRGEFNGWSLGDRLELEPDGSYVAYLDLEPGDYGYKLYEQGSGRWFLDPANPYFKWVSGERNSRLRVPDCARPALELLGATAVAGGRITFTVQYVDGAEGAGVDPASAQVERNGELVGSVFDPASGLFQIDDSGLAPGKYSYFFRASDQAGRAATPLYVPVWIEDAPFAWEDAILYFAMVDRFADGEPGNNFPVGGAVNFKADWQGGDFAGLRAKIESGYFGELGVNAIWISSISQNTAGSGAGTDGRQYSGYHSYWPISTGWRDDAPLPGVQPVDPHFGSLDDFKQLVRAAHERGIRVLVDFVANHVHTDSPLWQQHQYSGWFHDDPIYVCGWDQPITCWFATYLPDFEYKNLEVLETVVEHAVWLVQETDIDGFRLDAVKHMIHDFSFALRARIQERVATSGLRFYMVGETFTGEDGAGLIAEYVRPEELDGQFDFPLYWQVVKTFLRQEQDFRGLEGMLQANQGVYGDWAVMSNFLGNHDVCRALSHAAGDIADMWGNGSKEQGWNNPPALPASPAPFARLRMAWTFLMTVPGIPLIYYGDEFGMEGAGDPDNRKFMRFGAELNAHQLATLDHVKRLAAARHAHRAFRYGSRTQLHMDGDGLLWAYGMVAGADKAVVVFNGHAGAESRAIPVSSLGLTNGTQLTDVVHARQLMVASGSLTVSLDGLDTAVLVLP